MSRLHSPRVWFVLFGAGTAFAVACLVVLVGAVGGFERGIESLLITGFASLAATGWFKAYRQSVRTQQVATALATAHQATAAAALRDPVTGLGNYRMFDTHLRAAFARAQRYGNPFSVLLIEVNLSGGTGPTSSSTTGDRVLSFVGKVLSRELRGADLVARVGEFTFGVVMPETEFDGARLAWDRLRNAILGYWPEHRTWSLSGGAAGYSVDVGCLESLISDADRRLALEKRRLRAEPEP
jgi:diguanylate cyclase (GGDEF)-like protein